MNSLPRNWSIRWKLTFMAMITTAIALLIAVAALALFEYIVVRHELLDEQDVQAAIIGENCAAAILFNRGDDATSILSALSRDPDSRAAAIYAADGTLLAQYVATGPAAPAIPPHPLFKGTRITTELIESFHPVKLDGKEIGTIYMRNDMRDLYARLALFAWVSPLVLLAASAAGLLIIRRLQRSVSIPVVMLAETARRVSEEHDYTLRAPNFGGDEVGKLADAFNYMLDGIRDRDARIQAHLKEVQGAQSMLEERVAGRTADLTRANAELQGEMERRRDAELKREQMQANLVEASRKAGMADVATGVLHNVGNVLNSVNVSAQLVHDAVKASRSAILGKAADLLRENSTDLPAFFANDARAKALPDFLTKLAGALSAEREQLLKELSGLASSIGHIREIVAMQQSLAKVSGIVMQVTVGEMIEDALKINQAGLARHQVVIVRNFDASLGLTTDRHKVLQILINLVSNAKYAVDATAGERRIAISAARVNERSVQIVIADNGIGIDAGNLTRIFGYGFTTKKNGHGFGLHSAALAAKELGGTLEVHSEGRGKGATFALTLPCTQEQPSHAR